MIQIKIIINTKNFSFIKKVFRKTRNSTMNTTANSNLEDEISG